MATPHIDSRKLRWKHVYFIRHESKIDAPCSLQLQTEQIKVGVCWWKGNLIWCSDAAAGVAMLELWSRWLLVQVWHRTQLRVHNTTKSSDKSYLVPDDFSDSGSVVPVRFWKQTPPSGLTQLGQFWVSDVEFLGSDGLQVRFSSGWFCLCRNPLTWADNSRTWLRTFTRHGTLSRTGSSPVFSGSAPAVCSCGPTMTWVLVGPGLSGFSVRASCFQIALLLKVMDNLLAQVTGRKRVALYRPQDALHLYLNGEVQWKPEPDASMFKLWGKRVGEALKCRFADSTHQVTNQRFWTSMLQIWNGFLSS